MSFFNKCLKSLIDLLIFKFSFKHSAYSFCETLPWFRNVLYLFLDLFLMYTPATSNTYLFRQLNLKPSCSVMHSSGISDSSNFSIISSISWQHLHSNGFTTNSSTQEEHRHLQGNTMKQFQYKNLSRIILLGTKVVNLKSFSGFHLVSFVQRISLIMRISHRR